MGIFTKDMILSIINEQVSQEIELNEMPAELDVKNIWNVIRDEEEPIARFTRADFMNPDEVKEKYKYDPRKKNYYDTLLSIKPELYGQPRERLPNDTTFNKAYEDELTNEAISYRLLQYKPKPEHYFYEIYNYGSKPTTVDSEGNTLYHYQKLYIWVHEDDLYKPLGILNAAPRNTAFGRPYKKKDEPVESPGEWAKNNLHFPLTNQFFSEDNDIKTMFFKCGIPPIPADKDHAEPESHKNKESKYELPTFNYKLHGNWEQKDVQSALNMIMSYREAFEEGREVPKLPASGVMPRYSGYPHRYRGGPWDTGQKIMDPRRAKMTKKYKLWMRAINGGDMSFITTSDIVIMGSIRNNNAVISAELNTKSELRTVGSELPDKVIYPVDTIKVFATLPLPQGFPIQPDGDLTDDAIIKLQRGAKKSEVYKFYYALYVQLFEKLKQKILEINPSVAIAKYLEFEPEDFEMELDETTINENVKPKKIRITESQLKMLLPKPKKIKITESQLKTLLKKDN